MKGIWWIILDSASTSDFIKYRIDEFFSIFCSVSLTLFWASINLFMLILSIGEGMNLFKILYIKSDRAARFFCRVSVCYCFFALVDNHFPLFFQSPWRRIFWVIGGGFFLFVNINSFQNFIYNIFNSIPSLSRSLEIAKLVLESPLESLLFFYVSVQIDLICHQDTYWIATSINLVNHLQPMFTIF